MNAVLYLRYSSDKQTEQSIEGQQRICTNYCNQNEIKIVGTYIDRAVSASKNTEKREAFQQMIKDSDKRNFEAVIVYKLDRFSRDRYDSAIYKNKLRKNGVRVISATENISDNPEGIILESVLEGMAEFYSKELAQKVNRGMHETALKANSCGGAVPLGYRIENKKFVLDPKTAPLVKEAFTRYAEGETAKQIADDFNARGYRTSKGALFNKSSFRGMFQNERYKGIYIHKEVRIDGGLPAIIDAETFETVQKRMDQNKQQPARKKAKIEYLLSGKLFCGKCQSAMIGESGTGARGTIYNYYNCAKRKKDHSCDKRNVKKEWIEDLIIDETLSILTPENIDHIADMAIKQAEKDIQDNTSIPALKKKTKEIEISINNLIKLAERGSTSETLFKRLEELETQKKQTEIEIATQGQHIPILEKKQIVWWLSQFANGNKEDPYFRRALIEMLINSITIWDEPDGHFKITIIYNLRKNNSTTIKCSSTASNVPPNKRIP